MRPKIIYFEKYFYKNAFRLLKKILNEHQIILISGGNSIRKILTLSNENIKINKSRVIILSDERIYNDQNDIRTNYTNLKKNFFSIFKFSNLKYIYFNLGYDDKIIVNTFYQKIKNKIPRAAILSLGNDGHICSIFGGTKKNNINEYVDVVKPSKKIKRVTVNKNYLANIENIYVLVNGVKKGKILDKIISGKTTKFPLKSFKNITFILDDKAYKSINIYKN